MRIYNNVSALKNTNILNNVNKSKSSNLEKLSSGLRINKASDDAAGLAISEKMRSQIRGMKQAVRNASDGQALIQTAEGALSEATSILQRMRELAVQRANATNGTDEQAAIDKELEQLSEQIGEMATNVTFNGQALLGGATIKLQIGANAGDELDVKLATLAAPDDNEIGTIDASLKKISEARASLGAQVNRLDFTINSLNTSIENLTDAESRIRDVDMASEMVEFSKNNILSQVGNSMLAQANALPQGILQLL